MSGRTKLKVIRFFAYALELLVLFVLQETPGLIPSVQSVRPLLVLPAALTIALFEGETAAMAFGLAGGLLIDFGFGTVLGFHALFLAVGCYFISLVAANLFQTNFFSALLLTAVAAAGIFLLQWLFFFVLRGYAHSGYALLFHYLPFFCYTTVMMPLIYYFNRALALQIRSKEE
ncbi:MAG: rod shape-determining protein MreD [Oscillospiraceae bacterium]|jgi:rod shape-determining protein MreD|nr:rod shape-determining protein MreD [Oscillospiraceae bacterium]